MYLVVADGTTARVAVNAKIPVEDFVVPRVCGSHVVGDALA